MASIASLHVYPVKSCRGIDLDTARVTATGLEWDRRWMVVDARDRFMTQRTHPQLATITTAIADGALRLSAAGHPLLDVDAEAGGPVRRVQIWKDSCSGIDAGDAVAAWLSDVLGDRLRLVRMDERIPRLANPQYAGSEPQPINFTDGYPLLLLSRESVAELNRRLPAPVPMSRFRPNVVIEGVAAHAEDEFTDFRVGAVVLRGIKHCTRCVVTTTDQLDGSRDPDQEPLRTLKTYRHDRVLHGVTFGQNCIVAAGIGASISAGDEIALDAGAPAPS
jgi:uncharacterized protein YcbX